MMPESFLILLSAGIMLAAAVSSAREVTLLWLRLCGIIALTVGGLACFFAYRTSSKVEPLLAATLAAIAVQLLLASLSYGRLQRIAACAAYLLAVLVGTRLLRQAPENAPRQSTLLLSLSALGISAMTGLALMDMLLGHAYLTASKMTIAPFRRLNLALAVVIVYRIAIAVGVVLLLQYQNPVYMLWPIHGLYILTRWIVGLLVPAIFIYMAQDCINRRSTQSATGILYVAAVLVFIGEIIATHLARATALPF
jgi:hypothetical protein